MSFVLIKKNGDIETKKAKQLTLDTLYKKCGFRSDNHFERLHIWSVILNKEQYLIALYGKMKGRAGQENKYELPPPLDSKMLYGNVSLVRLNEQGEIEDFTKEEWNKVYEALYGGFEDLANTKEKDSAGEDSELASEDDEANYDESMLTKTGYLKDDFIETDDDYENDEEYKPSKKREETKTEVKESDYEIGSDDEENEENDENDEDEYDDEDKENGIEETEPEETEEEVVLEDEYTDSELSEEEFTDSE